MKHFLSKKLFSVLLLSFCLVVLGGITIVYGQNTLQIDKDIILGTGKSIKFGDNSTLNSATGLGGGAWTTTSTKIYPQAATYVGIGTTNPTSPLYVVGTTTIAGVLQVGAGGGIGEAATSTVIYRSQFVDSDNTAYYLDPANTTTAAKFGGKVYITRASAGTAPAWLPQDLFFLEDSISPILQLFGPSDGGAGISFSRGGASAARNRGVISYNFVNDLMKFSTADNANSDVVITSSGNFGIGTISPTVKLHVNNPASAEDTNVTFENLRTTGAVGAYLNVISRATAPYAGILYKGGATPTEYWAAGLFGGTDFKISRSSGTGNLLVPTGNVGIGVASPTRKLEVAGVIYASEGTAAADIIADKIDGATFDPVYTIEGNRYATYMAGMVGGVKEELSDIATLVAISNEELYSYTIDLNNKKRGSDEWLFAHTVDVERNGLKNVAVLLTPNFDGKVWYEKSEQDKKITIFGIPSAHTLAPSDYEVSYRLTAPRFDAKDWTNYSSSEWEGLNFDTYYKKAN